MQFGQVRFNKIVQNLLETEKKSYFKCMESIFTQIKNGKLKAHFIYRDDLCFSILSIHPLAEGHILLIPNQEIESWYHLETGLMNHLSAVAKYLARELEKIFPCKKVALLIAGLEVPHVHFHLVPINEATDLDWSKTSLASEEKLQSTVDKIRGHLESLSGKTD